MRRSTAWRAAVFVVALVALGACHRHDGPHGPPHVGLAIRLGG